ncbi:hypothetical protein ACUCFN_004448, partial [Escherichia coli]
VNSPNTVAPPSAAAVPEPDKGSDILFSPVNKKGPPAARKKQHPVKGTHRYLLCGVFRFDIR